MFFLHKFSSVKVCQWFVTGRWFSPGTLLSSTNKTDRHDINEILLKVALNTRNQTIKLLPKNKCIFYKAAAYWWSTVSCCFILFCQFCLMMGSMFLINRYWVSVPHCFIFREHWLFNYQVFKSFGNICKKKKKKKMQNIVDVAGNYDMLHQKFCFDIILCIIEQRVLSKNVF